MTALRKNDIVTLGELEYVLKRPHIYIGSVKEEIVEKLMYVDDKMVKQKVPYIPGLLKIVEEVIDNSIDEAIETDFQYATQINITYKDGVITVRDNGRGLPITKVKGTNKYVPEDIFCELRTGSNFDDEKRSQKEKKGMNGVGVSLTNIFSEYLTVSTANGAKSYKQKFECGPVHRGSAKVGKSTNNFTEVCFKPNYGYFKASEDFMATFPDLIFRVLQNAAFCFPEIAFKFNGKKIQGKNLKSFMGQIHEINEYSENEKVRLGVFCSDDGFEHLSFVNGLETSRGGTHLEYATDWLVHHIREFLIKKHKIEVKPADIKSKLFVMLNFRVPAPDFDGQTKERFMNPAREWNERWEKIFSTKFINALCKNPEIVTPIVDLFQAKKDAAERAELRKMGSTKKNKPVRVAKYLPATKRRKYLCLTEGDSAKGGISGALGRDDFSYFPLRGKPLNALEATVKKITANKEIDSVVKITNMRLDKDDQRDFRYENVLICADQDADGIHIRALLLSFYSRFASSLLKQGRIQILQTPLVVAKKGKKIHSYYFSLRDYQQAEAKGKVKGCQITYYKGLGTWEAKDLKAIIAKEGIEKFIIPLKWTPEADQSITDWVGTETDARKVFLKDKRFSLEAL